ncbi:MAG: nitrogenase-stabilizing/protective protein NifW, partial [Acetobacteraceae bacterium]
HLETAYQDFVRSSPIAERVFKVHQDAMKPAKPAKRPFVPLTALTGSGA